MRQPPFRNQHLFTAHTFAKPLPIVLSRAFPTFSQFQFHSKEKSHSNSLVAEQPVSGARKPCQGLTPLRARNAGLRLSNDPREYAQAKRWSASRAAVLPQQHPSRVPPPPGHRTSPPHRRGRRAGRMRAALPGVPATLPPHPLGELVTSCPRPISVRGQSVAPCRSRRVSASPFLPAPRP